MRERIAWGAIVLVLLIVSYIAGEVAHDNAKPVIVCRDATGRTLTVTLQDGDTYRCMVTDDDLLVLPKVNTP